MGVAEIGGTYEQLDFRWRLEDIAGRLLFLWRRRCRHDGKEGVLRAVADELMVDVIVSIAGSTALFFVLYYYASIQSVNSATAP